MQFIDLAKQQSFIRKKLDKRISDVLDHGQYIMGPEVEELEEKLAEYVGVKHCIACSSGTDALLIPLMAKGIGQGDAVITTSFTFIATAEAVKLTGATPIFVDIDPHTFNIDPNLIPQAIESAQNRDLQPKAIIPVDLFGLPAEYEEIGKIAEENDLFVLEDAAQAFGGEINGSKAGSFGNVAATSFFPAKPLGCYGDGGAVFTHDEGLAHIMKSIRVHGEGQNKYENIRLGLNGRLDTIQAAILLEKLSIFPEEVLRRNKIAEYYMDNLSGEYKMPYIPDNYLSSWAQFSILAGSGEKRDCAMKKLSANNIPSMLYYCIPLHLQTVFMDLRYKDGDCPVSEKLSKLIFSIPMHSYLKQSQQDEIIDILNG